MSKQIGYHVTSIKKGELGELSKVQEELDEAFDALKQNNPVIGFIRTVRLARCRRSLSIEVSSKRLSSKLDCNA